ncbi:hypothetical protein [Streptosporangium roseum]
MRWPDSEIEGVLKVDDESIEEFRNAALRRILAYGCADARLSGVHL